MAKCPRSNVTNCIKSFLFSTYLNTIDSITFGTEIDLILGGNFETKRGFSYAFDNSYIDGIRGRIVQTISGPCICDISFKYVVPTESQIDKEDKCSPIYEPISP